jgi:hypothetical protein
LQEKKIQQFCEAFSQTLKPQSIES